MVPTAKVTVTNGDIKTVATKLEVVEKEHILAVLKQTGWKVSYEKRRSWGLCVEKE